MNALHPPSASIADRPSILARERSALAAHRDALRGSDLPPPGSAPRGTFLHGFLLLFALVVATIRDRNLRGPYLRVTAVRCIIVLAVTVVAFSGNSDKNRGDASADPKVTALREAAKQREKAPVKLDMPGLHLDIDGDPASRGDARLRRIVDEKHGKRSVTVLGEPVAIEEAVAPPPPPPRWWERVSSDLSKSWAWVLALLAFVSTVEAIVVFLSRRWDDRLSFHVSRLAGIKPEDDTPTEAKIALDIKWLYRKGKRRIRGYVVFAAGVPALLPLRLFPSVGAWVFSLGLTLWAWYWLGVFAAAKSAHAWADEGSAPSPAPIRLLCENVAKPWWAWPVRIYGRVWAWLTRGIDPAAATFERSPAAFMGLALARAILALPGLYFLARPMVPVAAGRICAESDPRERFFREAPRADRAVA